ncbi:ABC transporter permease [Agrobacterium salinitolerans]|uniref:ABC transporter permease n=1 Tax=Agrobacterium salinitolerans TaxID=1183413 RepID=A0A9X3KW13_9HYPH|nr:MULTISPECIES: ABC transporter permease [Agrobacterium]MCZ7854967.1 ABC transporter permease [Agrobacterium salinitolerans]MCZ7894786.1 ABC transporter permease [Agrobacterium salinitolerans]MCZ7940681.1 ABC transporter permease [Agrobacterium salinitolerans]TRA83170.1 ABC transporter permease [Agrobacterium salinitolerans]
MTSEAVAATRPVKAARLRYGGRSETLLMLVSIVAGLVVWQLVAQRYSSFVLASPAAVAVRLGEMVVSGELPAAFAAALQHMVIGFVIACGIAFPLGFLMGRIRFVHDLLDPIVNLIYAVPSVAWAPFIMIWFGLYLEARIALVVMMCMFDMIIVISSGARNVDRKLINVGRSFGASGWQRTKYVMLPESLPFTFTALRIGLVRAVNAMITAELFLAAVNLGRLMKQASVRFDSAAVLGILVVLSLTGLLLQELLLIIERRICIWRPNK